MVSLEVIAIVLTGLGLAASIIYYANILNNANKTRELQLFMQMYQNQNTEDWWTKWAEVINLDVEDYDDFLVKFDHSINPESFGRRGEIWYSYNVIGYLLMDGDIDIKKAWRLAGITSVMQWEKWSDIILELRERQNIPSYFVGFEHLYKELIKYRKEHPELAT